MKESAVRHFGKSPEIILAFFDLIEVLQRNRTTIMIDYKQADLSIERETTA